MFGLGWTEIFIIAGIIALLLLARRLPELSRSAREATRNFKRSLGEDDVIDVTPGQGAGDRRGASERDRSAAP